MSSGRTRAEKVAVTIAAAALTWVVGATLIYRSGGINTSGLLPTAGSLLALLAALRSDTPLMWLGTGVAVVSAAMLVFSVGLVILPAGVALVLGSMLLGSASSSTAR